MRVGLKQFLGFSTQLFRRLSVRLAEVTRGDNERLLTPPFDVEPMIEVFLPDRCNAWISCDAMC